MTKPDGKPGPFLWGDFEISNPPRRPTPCRLPAGDTADCQSALLLPEMRVRCRIRRRFERDDTSSSVRIRAPGLRLSQPKRVATMFRSGRRRMPSGQRSLWRLRRLAGVATRCGWRQPRSGAGRGCASALPAANAIDISLNPIYLNSEFGSGGNRHGPVFFAAGAKNGPKIAINVR